MLSACGRAPRYSGKLIARAVELYLNGVKPGYIRWDELQATLQKEFPSDFPPVADDLPSPETVVHWVRKYPNAPERLKQLRVQELAQGTSRTARYQLSPKTFFPPQQAAVDSTGIAALTGYLLALTALGLVVRLTWFLTKG